MENYLVDPEDQTLRNWIPFIEVFDRACREKRALGEFGHLHFHFPCSGFGNPLGAANGRHLCNFGILVQFSDNEVFVSLYDEDGGSLEFGKESFGTAWESSFGSLIQPEPSTELGIAFAQATGYFEESAMRLIPFLVHAYRISPVEAAFVKTSWSLMFEPKALGQDSKVPSCFELAYIQSGI